MLYERDYLLGLTEAEKQEYEEATGRKFGEKRVREKPIRNYNFQSASVSFLYFPVNQIKELPSSMTYPFILTNRFYPMKTLDLFYI